MALVAALLPMAGARATRQPARPRTCGRAVREARRRRRPLRPPRRPRAGRRRHHRRRRLRAGKTTAGAASSAPAKASTGTSAAAPQGVAPQAPPHPASTPQPSGTPTTAKPGLLDPLKDLLSPILSPLLPKAPTTAPPAGGSGGPASDVRAERARPGPDHTVGDTDRCGAVGHQGGHQGDAQADRHADGRAVRFRPAVGVRVGDGGQARVPVSDRGSAGTAKAAAPGSLRSLLRTKKPRGSSGPACSRWPAWTTRALSTSPPAAARPSRC
ncbi:hypothetical protein ACU686_39810 [Yinghuangia aomiensis]